MAILDVLMEHMRCPDHIENFVDCSTAPPTETSYGDLLTVFSDTSEVELGKLYELRKSLPEAAR